MTKGTVERGYAKGNKRREAILAAATQLFSEVGYRSASLREVASRVGISHPGLLHHFPTKTALLEAVLARRDEIDAAALEADLASGVEMPEALLRLVERNAARPGIIELFTVLGSEATARDHPAHAYFETRYRTVIGQTRGQLETWKEQGILRSGIDTLVAARTAVAIMDGLQIQWLYERADNEGEPVDMTGVLRVYLGSLMQ